MTFRSTFAILAAACLACLPLFASAQQHDADALAKQLANPVASLISVPFQLNYDTGYANNGEKWLLNVQPVIPISLNDKWNLISRTILPIIDQKNVLNDGSQSGLGDTVQSFFFSPKDPVGGWIVGVGPAMLLPTATDDLLGQDQWALGPTAVVLKQTATGWTYGALMNQLWSVAGDEQRPEVNAMFLQPFLTKGLGKGRTVSLNLESTYDWERKQWTIPMNLGYSKVSKLGSQLVSWQGGVRVYLDAPVGGPNWGLRFTFTLLFPK
jgi:Putative MetA-pathway of phenol degradation